MKIYEPFEVHQIEAEPRSWSAAIWSVIAHALVILVLLLNPSLPRPDVGDIEPSPDAQTIALPPNVRFEHQEQPPPPPDRPTPLGPDSRNPDAPPQEAGPVTEAPTEPAPQAPTPEETEREPEEAAPPAMERIPTPRDLASGGTVLGPSSSPFPSNSRNPVAPPAGGMTAGRTRVGSMGAVGMRAQDSRVFTNSFPEAAGRCVEIPDLGKNPDGTPVLASVIGVVRDERGRPLAGANLVILGKPYSTFSDGQGNYRLEFDPSLLERCRTQYVRVTAPGYRGADLQLSVGRNIRSDDVFLRRQ